MAIPLSWFLDRDIFLLRETAGLTYEEIAAACDVHTGAVRTRLHEARQKLRSMLGTSLDVREQRGVRAGDEPCQRLPVRYVPEERDRQPGRTTLQPRA